MCIHVCILQLYVSNISFEFFPEFLRRQGLFAAGYTMENGLVPEFLGGVTNAKVPAENDSLGFCPGLPGSFYLTPSRLFSDYS